MKKKNCSMWFQRLKVTIRESWSHFWGNTFVFRIKIRSKFIFYAIEVRDSLEIAQPPLQMAKMWFTKPQYLWKGAYFLHALWLLLFFIEIYYFNTIFLGVGTLEYNVDICCHYLTLKPNRLAVDNFQFVSWWNSLMRQTQPKESRLLPSSAAAAAT